MKDGTIERFKREVPGLKIRPKKRNGTERHEVVTLPRDAKRAIPGNPCHCTVANATKRTRQIPAAMVGITTAYLLEPCGDGWYEAVKYMHDGGGVAEALDVLPSERIPKATVTFRPPLSSRAVGGKSASATAARASANGKRKASVSRRKPRPTTREAFGLKRQRGTARDLKPA